MSPSCGPAFLSYAPVCPVGMSECTAFGVDPPTDPALALASAMCSADGCAQDTSGPCEQASTGECSSYFDGTAVCPTGTAACYNAVSSTAPKSRSKSVMVVRGKGSAMSVFEGSREYIAIVSSQDESKASMLVSEEPCKDGQLSWRAFCLPVVVTLGSSAARAMQGVWALLLHSSSRPGSPSLAPSEPACNHGQYPGRT